ncbi:unnamed protein product [Schistosoma mattheei]|uniref:Uncharacterized protein n=1 Tax=Schistosoma mattheei TaxID=31246 RepID=A0A183Q6T7_9TREM|nr:unnamed protein product [Schistosoma mattheei]
MPVCINYESVNELDIQSRVNMKGVSTRNYEANNEGEIKFVTCLLFGKFHFRNSYAFCYAKCFKCGNIGHVQSVYKAAVHFTSSGTESCNLDPIVEVHQDDFIVHGSDKVVHDQRLIDLLRRLIEKNIIVNPNQCLFCVSSFKCLGYLVDGNGFKQDITRLTPLTNAPPPENLIELLSLMSAFQYYSRPISNFSFPANCLFNLSTSNCFKWDEEQKSCL